MTPLKSGVGSGCLLRKMVVIKLNWELYTQLATEHGATVQEDTEGDCENWSWCAGKDIFLGQYEDEELRDISFFHELGHIAWDRPKFSDWPYCKYNEALAWRVGLELASQLGVTFSEEALTWATEQLVSYFHDRNSEGCPTRHLPQALRDAGLSFEGGDRALTSDG